MSAAAQCDSEQENASNPVRVRSVRELFEKLSGPDEATRLSVLDAVRMSPDVALTFGLFEGRDVIDVLIQQAERLRGNMEWFRWIGALAAFRDRRVVRLFVSLLASEMQGELLFALARYLRQERVDTFRTEVLTALMQNESAVRARAAAEAIGGSPCNSVAEQLRLALLGQAEATPPVFSAARAEWRAELNGPFRLEACFHLEREGPEALSSLASCWNELSESNQEWLVGWSSEHDPTVSAAIVRQVLRFRSSDRLSHAALSAAAALRPVPDDVNELIRPFLTHSNETIRCAAAEAASAGVDWRALYENASIRMKEICVRKLTEAEGLRAIPDLLLHLQDPEWRIRAAAADALRGLGEPAARSVLDLLPNADDTVRVAIARVLIQLDRE